MPTSARFCAMCAQPLSQPGASTVESGPIAKGEEPEQELRASGQAQSAPGRLLEGQPLPGSISQPASPPPVAPVLSARQRSFVPNIAVIALVLVVIAAIVGGSLYLVTRPHTTNTSGLQARATTTPTSPTSPTTPPSVPLAFNAPASADMDGMHIQLYDGLECQSQLVLKQSQTTYNSTAIQQMQTYLSALAHGTGYTESEPRIGTFFDNTRVPVPDTLQWVPGGAYCEGVFAFTATGTQSIQINNIGVTFDTASMTNSFAYHLVDMCSVLGQQPLAAGGPCGCYQCGTGGGTYAASLLLQGGPAGTQINAPIIDAPGSDYPLPMILDPSQPEGQQLILTVNSSLAQELYRVHLTVSITTAEGTHVVTLPSSFTSTLAFAAASQFDCYQLQGTSFTQEPLPGNPTGDAFPCI